MATEIARRRITVDEYHKMAEVGILTEDERIELIDGEVVQMSAVGSKHIGCVLYLDEFLKQHLQGSFHVLVQSPILTDRYGEPEPDLTVLKPRADNYRSEPPRPEDVIMIIEVADTSLVRDLNTKFPMYAQAGIPESWLANLKDKTFERHSDPENGRYKAIRIAEPGDKIESTVIPGLVFDVNEIFGE